MIDQSAHPEHRITVTGGGPFGRAYFDCTCGIARTFASKHAANVAAIAHHNDLSRAAAKTKEVA